MRISRPALTAGPAKSVVQDPEAPSVPASAADAEWPNREQPRGIKRVPTHAVGRARERRGYPPAPLSLPPRLERGARQRHTHAYSLPTRKIRSSGTFFFSPPPLFG